MSADLAAVAVDLGASGGRVLLGRVGPDRLDARVLHRFPNDPVTVDGRLCWDIEALWCGVLEGIRAAVRGAGRAAAPTSVGVATWGVDYGLLDADGALLAPPVHYRDSRTDGVAERVRDRLGAERLYTTTGLQYMAINTVFQLAAERPEVVDRASRLLLMPDLFVARLTGSLGAERTDVSTTGLYDVRAGDWAGALIGDLGLRRELFPAIREPGTAVGPVLPAVRDRLGSGAGLEVTLVGSHDTASAVAAVPASTERFGYISCGTWSLVGVELDRPVLSAASRAANFTNEVGVDGTIRYLRNVAGLWLLQESLRAWTEAGDRIGLAEVLAAAAREPAGRSVVDAESAEFVPPGDMPARIRAACRRADQPEPATPAAVTRCILDSLAQAHARALANAAKLSRHRVDVVHMVGGGSRNELLCQLTADACGLPVVAGPVEATALGNLLVQARGRGVLADRWAARELVRRTQQLTRYEPRDGHRGHGGHRGHRGR